MDYHKDIESTLNALLLNTEELATSPELSTQQTKLLDHLFREWNLLSEDEQQTLIAAKIETKVHKLAKQNHACLNQALTDKPKFFF